ncbi:MAG: hypothetical protein U0V74_10080 [Chitinophagales bacterium]
MKGLLLFLWLLPACLVAQLVDSFTVKKPVSKPNGFYCSDYMTDGRLCFVFTEDHKLSCFSSDKNPSEIPDNYLASPHPYYTAPYSVKGDSLFFATSMPVVGPSGERVNQVTSGRGIMINDQLFFTVTTQAGLGSPSTRQVVVKKLPKKGE